jgi:excisionase family DNA binding protein
MSTTLLTKDETAEILRLTARQVAKLARRGELPSVNLPGNEVRFDPADLAWFVESRKRPAKGQRGRDE